MKDTLPPSLLYYTLLNNNMLCMLCECIGTTVSEDEIRKAFAAFDEEGTGKIHKDRRRELLTTMGDCYTDAKVCCLYTYMYLIMYVCVPPQRENVADIGQGFILALYPGPLEEESWYTLYVHALIYGAFSGIIHRIFAVGYVWTRYTEHLKPRDLIFLIYVVQQTFSALK